jgi:hypothetical protein
MARKGKKAVSQPRKEEQPEVPDAGLQDHVIERPDGFYWVSKSKGETYGPFTTLAEAEADMQAGGAPAEAEAPESLQEAESELGISEWIDPDTGGPAEDSVPRIEDH